MADVWQIGDFDEKVTVLRPTITTGDQGQKTRTWEKHSTVWAKVVRNVSEMVDNGNLEDGRSLEVHIYKINGLDSRWRVCVGGVPYEIRSVDQVSRLSPVCILSLYSIEG